MAYVIKVEYEGSLGRLLASRSEKEDLSLAKLEARIQNFPTALEPENVSTTAHEAEEGMRKESTSTPKKVTRKTVKIVDPVFQRLLPPNQISHMMQNTAKIMTSQIHMAKKEHAPRAAAAATTTPGSTRQVKFSDPIGAERKTEPNTHSQISNQILNHEVSSSSSSRKGGNEKECQPCEQQPITAPRCVVGATRTVVKLVRKSPAVYVGPASLGRSPLLVCGPRSRPVKTC